MIRAMSPGECRVILEGERLGRLGCGHAGRVYVVPISYAMKDGIIYFLATPGRKIEWMRENPFVCLQVDRIRSRFDWRSVVATGVFDEIPVSDAYKRQRETAWEVLRAGGNWWEPAYARTVVEGVPRPMEPLYVRILIDDVSGRQMIEDERPMR